MHNAGRRQPDTPDPGISPPCRGADGRGRVRGVRRDCGHMRIGDTVTWHGRRYVVLGMDPMGLPERRADLEDAETGELLQVPLAELEAARSAR